MKKSQLQRHLIKASAESAVYNSRIEPLDLKIRTLGREIAESRDEDTQKILRKRLFDTAVKRSDYGKKRELVNRNVRAFQRELAKLF